MSGSELRISLSNQTLEVREDGAPDVVYKVSTGRNGPGEKEGSECTPRGWHEVCEKIGAGELPGTVFVGRRVTGEIYHPDMRRQFPDRDWILTRILWLNGLEEGRNRSGDVDTRTRFIYIHGAPDDDPLGTPSSRGCIKMRSADVIALFDRVREGTRVHIVE